MKRLFLLLLLAAPMYAQDSPAALDQRWRDAGTTPRMALVVGDALSHLAPAPHPGYWHCATAGNFRYCPCYPLPYTNWIDPETNNNGYFRYDFSPVLWSLAAACGLVPQPCIDGQGGPNHTRQGIGGGYVVPLEPQPDQNNYYPVPEAGTGLGAIWAQFNTSPPAFPGTNYPQHIKTNPVWVTAYNYKKPVMDADPGCQSGPPPTATKTPVPTTPTVTPTPAPNIYARYIIWAYDQHIVAGCAPNLFCPGDPSTAGGLVTRGQLCVYEYKARLLTNPTEPLPPCRPVFTDVLCGAP